MPELDLNTLLTTLLGGLIAIFGSQFSTNSSRKEKRREEARAHQAEQRDALIDLIDSLDRWLKVTETLTYSLAQTQSNADWRSISESETVEKVGDLERDLARNIVRCRLVLTHPDLQEFVHYIRNARNERLEIHGAIFHSTFGSPERKAAAVRAVSFYRAVAARSDRFDETASGVFARDLEVRPRRRGRVTREPDQPPAPTP